MPQQNKENNTLGLHNINNYATYINNLWSFIFNFLLPFYFFIYMYNSSQITPTSSTYNKKIIFDFICIW